MTVPESRSTFGRSDVVRRGWRKGLCTLSKVSNTCEFCSSFNSVGSVEQLKRICKDAFRMAGAVQETCSSEMLGCLGADFLRRVAFWSIRSSGFAKMILRDRCSTSYDLASLFRGRHTTLDRRTEKREMHWYEAVSSALNFSFLKEVSQNALKIWSWNCNVY